MFLSPLEGVLLSFILVPLKDVPVISRGAISVDSVSLFTSLFQLYTDDRNSSLLLFDLLKAVDCQNGSSIRASALWYLFWS